MPPKYPNETFLNFFRMLDWSTWLIRGSWPIHLLLLADLLMSRPYITFQQYWPIFRRMVGLEFLDQVFPFQTWSSMTVRFRQKLNWIGNMLMPPVVRIKFVLSDLYRCQWTWCHCDPRWCHVQDKLQLELLDQTWDQVFMI